MPACLPLLGKSSSSSSSSSRSRSSSSSSSSTRAHRRTKDAVVGVRVVVAVIVAVLAAAAIGRAATLGRNVDPNVTSSAEQLHESILLDLLLLRTDTRTSPQEAGRPDTKATRTTTTLAEAAKSSAVATDDADDSATRGGSARDDDNKTTTLALLYPPGLQGGYRNQVLRVVALCHHALRHNRTLYLPSLWWSTQRKWARRSADLHRTNATDTNQEDYVWYPVPMDLLFDVEYWNQYALANPDSLPLLVESLPPRHESDNNDNHSGDCWSTATHQGQSSGDADYLQREVELRGHLVPVANWTHTLVQWPPPSPLDDNALGEYNPRRHDLLPLVQHCTHPYVHGGGRMAGRLWNEYLGLHQEASSTTRKKNKSTSEGVYESVLRALQPREKWRKVGIEHCLRSPSSNVEESRGDKDYAAVHARIEPEMMAHPCGRNMVRNLTVILDHVARLLLKNESSLSSTTSTTTITSVVVAVSREGLVDPRFPQFLELSRANLHTLNEYTGGMEVDDEDEIRTDRQPLIKRKFLHGQFPVVECGSEMMARYYRSLTSGSNKDRIGEHDAYGTLLEQVINFDLAVQAKLFVGVEMSSYSNAIWTTRFLLNKGANYKYTTSGIEPVVGMPPPHSNCPRGSAAATRGKRKRAP
jgi:hypothetical protein